jgi:hypothetical protein
MIATQKIKAGKAAGTGRSTAHSVHTAAKKIVRGKKNNAKVTTHARHNPAGMESRVISEEEQTGAHSLHTAALTNVQVKKNRTKAASHYQHSHAGMRSHTIS